MPEEIEQQVLGLRQAHMRWGPRKLKHILQRDEPGRNWPAASTIGALLQREGLVVPRRKRVRTAPYTEPLAHADGANHVWCADFKGWFRTACLSSIILSPLNGNVKMSPYETGDIHVESEGTSASDRNQLMHQGRHGVCQSRRTPVSERAPDQALEKAYA